MAMKPMGMGTPEPIGGPPPMEPDQDDMGGKPEGCMLSPDTVKYHEDAQNCGTCSHNQQGMCEVIGQQIMDEGGCMVWEGGHDEPDEDDMGGPMGSMAPAGGPPSR